MDLMEVCSRGRGNSDSTELPGSYRTQFQVAQASMVRNAPAGVGRGGQCSSNSSNVQRMFEGTHGLKGPMKQEEICQSSVGNKLSVYKKKTGSQGCRGHRVGACRVKSGEG